ncbi:hypothetical protein dqs_0638 [Azoarcus olearius]|uniref:helix-turn-helix domain-containing protein n=1 Tax=Azoarcus sp. (strain BH72) TaxID=418699 RepID=UPI0008062173|nr:hypothetical protein [Azoarcus olearius]ANQ83714.1 hypothetical protein dqs_0638 [Azoarcus olearius]
MKLKTYSGAQIRAYRKRLGMNQTKFWESFSITQSGACRYESGRDIPAPLQILLNIALGSEATSHSIVEALRQIRKPSELAALKEPATTERAAASRKG